MRITGVGICHLAQAVRGESEVLLKGVGGSNEEVKHIIEMVIMLKS